MKIPSELLRAMENCTFNPYQGENPLDRLVQDFQCPGEMSDDSFETLPTPTKTRVNSSDVGQQILKPRNLSETFNHNAGQSEEDSAEEEEEEEQEEEEEKEHEEEEEEKEDEKDTPQKKRPEFKLVMDGEDTWAIRTWDNEPANDTFCSKSRHTMSPGNK